MWKWILKHQKRIGFKRGCFVKKKNNNNRYIILHVSNCVSKCMRHVTLNVSKTSTLCSWMQSTVQDVFHCNENVFIKHVYMLYLLILISRLWMFIVTSNGNLANHFFIDISIWGFLLFFFFVCFCWIFGFFFNIINYLFYIILPVTESTVPCVIPRDIRHVKEWMNELEKYIVIYTWIELYGDVKRGITPQ